MLSFEGSDLLQGKSHTAPFLEPLGPHGRNGMLDNLLSLSWSRLAARLGAACAALVAGWQMSLAADLSKIETIVVIYPD